MAMSKADRFRLKAQLVDELNSERWTTSRLNLLFAEFGLGHVSNDFDGPGVEDLVAGAADEDLLELFSLAFDVPVEKAEAAVESAAGDGNWNAGYLRVFLSHSAVHKEFVGRVSDELAIAGIHGFVAHDSMTVSQSWQKQIERSLRTMDALVALVHPEFNASAWCNQEVGWALGRRVPVHVIRLGSDPAGFPSSDQWHSARNASPKEIAQLIGRWVYEQPGLGDGVTDGLLQALADASNFVDAGAAAERIATMPNLSQEQREQLQTIFWSNNQVYGGVLANRALKPMYERLGWDWPPSGRPENL